MRRSAHIVGVVLMTIGQAQSHRVWLVIGASDTSPAAIAEKAKALNGRLANGFVAQTSDCGDKKNVFAWVATVAPSAEAARAALPRVRDAVADVYVKHCDARPGSLLALGITAVDPSIADVPKDVVNWSDEDRVSAARPLPDGRALVIVRYFAAAPDDPLEGRRERVLLATPAGRRTVLDPNCTSPGGAAVQQGRLALHCAREQAGDHLLHTVLVFDEAGNKLKEIAHCRRPAWVAQTTLACEVESVGADGRLQLHLTRVVLPQ